MRICEILEMESIDKGAAITLQNKDKKSIFFLKKGTMKIIDATNKTTKYIVKKGIIFGELSHYDKRVAKEELAYALEDSIIYYIDSEQMEKLLQEHKSLKNGVLKIYGFRIKKLECRPNDLIYKDSKTRITEFITDYINEFGEKNDNGKPVANNLLSHKDIVNLTNTSRQTVNNVLSTLRKEKVINYDKETISIN